MQQDVFIWKKAAFIRLFIPVCIGIAAQWYWQPNPVIGWSIVVVSLLTIIGFSFLPLFKKFYWSSFNGIFINLLFVSIGSLLVFYQDIRNDQQWVAHFLPNTQSILVSLDENLIEKNNSFKADANVEWVSANNKRIPARGKVIVYFKKDSIVSSLHYGSQIIFNRPLQEIKNSGNPGSFDYKRYCLFQGITHQVYLKQEDFVILQKKKKDPLNNFLITLREKVVNILRTYIPGTKEQGLAEALLIGYKNDLDKTLVQSYTNTGVVHVIAISGLHLGLIYWILVQLLKPLQRKKQAKWPRLVLIISGLWLFSLLAGAQPSILRSAVMFSCIVIGESLSKKTSIYNSLALSAFLLLCYNPFWLWDVGFQLSYSAVLSIVIFMRPIYNWFYIKNKAFDFIWKLNAVTISAQILTLPISIFHFHQIPVHFLVTNLLAVPLSSIVLFGEIILCAVSFLPVAAIFAGKILHWLIFIMNSYIEGIEKLPYSLWDGLQISWIQTALLFLFIAGISYWLMEKQKWGAITGLSALTAFIMIRSLSFLSAQQQQKIIIYNVPKRQAIDFINGKYFQFVGDSDLLKDDFTRNFHLKPSRILHRVEPAMNNYSNTAANCYSIHHGKKVLLLDKTVFFDSSIKKQSLDLLILSKNPKVYISRLAAAFEIKQVVFDASVPFSKKNYWKRDCDSLKIPAYDVSEKGAFVMNLN
jgi:competence protein ComEC